MTLHARVQSFIFAGSRIHWGLVEFLRHDKFDLSTLEVEVATLSSSGDLKAPGANK